MHLVHWILCGVLDSDGRNADGHLDGRHAILSFVGAGLFSLFWVVSQLDGGWTQMSEISSEKFTLFNLTTDPAVGFTLWVAIIAVPFQNLSAFGVDQLNAQECFAAEMQGMPARP